MELVHEEYRVPIHLGLLVGSNIVAEPLDANNLVTIEDLAISSMWEIAALAEVLERKGVLARQEIYDAINALRQRHPEATTLERPARGSIRRPT